MVTIFTNWKHVIRGNVSVNNQAQKPSCLIVERSKLKLVKVENQLQIQQVIEDKKLEIYEFLKVILKYLQF